MQALRNGPLKKFVILVAGFALLNLGFLQCEFSLLHLECNKNLIQKLVSDNFEEETESGAESSSEEDPLKDSIQFQTISFSDYEYTLLIKTESNYQGKLILNTGYLFKFSPPPDFYSLS